MPKATNGQTRQPEVPFDYVARSWCHVHRARDEVERCFPNVLIRSVEIDTSEGRYILHGTCFTIEQERAITKVANEAYTPEAR